MADRYWRGGSGTWDATTTTNWSATSGGLGGASAPTSADNVIFNTLSNATLYTVTVGTNAACADMTVAGPATGAVTFSLGATAVINCYGSMTLPVTNCTFTITAGAILNFLATSTGKTITTNGVSFSSLTINLNGVGGEWTLGSALTSATITVLNGSFVTNNFNITASALVSQGTSTRSITLGSSTVTLSATTAIAFASTKLTLNAGTSQITCSATSPTFAGGGLTFYNVTFSSAAGGTVTITSVNTFNNLTFTSRSATGQKTIRFSASQTVSGTLTFGTSNTAIRRLVVLTDSNDSQRTITLNGTLAALADVDIKDIATAGTAGTWTGTRLGNGGNNSGITFDAPKTVYWNLAGTQSWSATGWATTNNGTPAVNNFPLAQDTATFTEAGAAGTINYDNTWWVGSIQMTDGVSNRTTAFTLATGIQSPIIFANITLFSSLTLSGTGAIQFWGVSTQTITSAGITFTQPITINGLSSTVRLNGNLTVDSARTTTLTSGTLDLTNNGAGNYVLSTGLFSSTNSNARTIQFGAGAITATGTGTVWNAATSTNLTITGQTTGTIDCTSASVKTFAGGGIYYPKLNQGGAGALTITGNNTFYDVTNTVQPTTVTFTAGSTTNVSSFNLNGTAGNLVTLNSSIPGTQFFLNKI